MQNLYALMQYVLFFKRKGHRGGAEGAKTLIDELCALFIIFAV
jgi:hypothetical protein